MADLVIKDLHVSVENKEILKGGKKFATKKNPLYQWSKENFIC